MKVQCATYKAVLVIIKNVAFNRGQVGILVLHKMTYSCIYHLPIGDETFYCVANDEVTSISFCFQLAVVVPSHAFQSCHLDLRRDSSLHSA